MPMPTFIDYLKLTFVAAKPPLFDVFEQVAPSAAEESGEYEKRVISKGGWPAVDRGFPGRADRR